MTPRLTLLLILLGGAVIGVAADDPAASEPAPVAARIPGFAAVGAPPNPKVPLAWNRFHDVEGLHEILRRLHAAHPGLTRLQEVGRSHEGRPILCLEVTNFAHGDPARKAAMYIDGNIHGNEVQAGEVVAYTAWLLCEQYGRVPEITRLVDERTFLLLPTINPDGRDDWFHSIHHAHTPHSSRTGKVPRDNDGDGAFDEDGPDDLDGDGHITQMRRANPHGRFRPHPDFPELLVPAPADQPGSFDLLDWEGIDNDGDGAINEDGAGGYDPNRNWAWDWQPEHIQGGAHDYPFSLPENRAVAEFVLARPNIAGAQSYHNAAGMMLRSPGRRGGEVQPEDEEVTAAIGRRGEEMIPAYDSLVIHKDLYTVWGGEIDWFYGARGIITFTNELWTDENLYRQNSPRAWGPGSLDFTEARRRFARDLLFGEAVRPWTKVVHPTYGEIEVGGMTKNFGRVPPSFLLEEECHRNAAFTLYHADQMPRLEWGEIVVRPVPGGLQRVDVTVRNTRTIPSRTAQARKYGATPPDLLSLEPAEGAAASAAEVVVAAGLRGGAFVASFEPVAARPWRLEVGHVPGMGAVHASFLVRPGVPLRLRYEGVVARLERDVVPAAAP